MANPEHLEILRQGVEAWNKWRKENEEEVPLLQRADLREINLLKADLREAKFGEADLRGTDLRGAKLGRADLRGTKLGGAKLGGADFRGANLEGVNFKHPFHGLLA